MDKKHLPVGVDKFTDLVSDDYYYVDKTFFLQRLIDNVRNGQVLLIARPRRFGKTLTMRMVRSFFDCRASEEERNYFANPSRIWLPWLSRRWRKPGSVATARIGRKGGASLGSGWLFGARRWRCVRGRIFFLQG